MSEKELLSSLLTDSRDTLKRLITKAERVFRIDRDTGNVILLPPKTKLTDRQLIAIQILGRYFACKLELFKEDTVGLEELKKLTQLEESSLSARLSELKKEGLVESSERGSYRVAYHSLESFGPLLEEMERGSASNEGSARLVPISESLASVNLANLTDTDAIVLTLAANVALPPADRWLSADEIVEWARDHGSPMRAETVTKYTLPQDQTLKPFLVKRKEGKRRLYQLSRQGIEKAKLLEEEALGKS
jgi:DNA-binding HxlR family transcriptional regulator